MRLSARPASLFAFLPAALVAGAGLLLPAVTAAAPRHRHPLAMPAPAPAPASLSASATTPAAGDALALAATAPNLPLPPFAYTRRVLPNGLTVLVHEDHKAPVVAVQVWYKVGSRDETPGRTGFAHLFEHLMFQGSGNYNQDYFRALEDAGQLAINGTTNTDRTNFFETVPSGALDRVLWLESDRMKNLLGSLDQAKLDEQRGVVQNEKRQKEASPYGMLNEVSAKASWPDGHPYSWTTIGSMADLDAASLADVRSWFGKYYGAANAILAISGDITPDQAVAKAEHYFGAVPPGPLVSRLQHAFAAPPGAPRTVVLTDTVPQILWTRTWNLPGGADPDTTYLEAVNPALVGAEAAPLYRRLVTEEKLATSVSAGLDTSDLASQFDIVVRLAPGAGPAEENRVDRIVTEELDRYLAQGPGPDVLARLRTQNYSAFVRGLESATSVSGWMSTCEASYPNGIEGCRQDLERLNGLTNAQAVAAARRWLAQPALTIVVRPGPERSVAGLAPAVAGAPDRADPTPRFAPPAPTPAAIAAHDALRASATDADRAHLPAVADAADTRLHLPPLRRARLANGIPVFIAERHEVPVAFVSWQTDTGTSAQDRAGRMNLMYSQIDKGAAGRSAADIDTRLQLLGADVSGAVGPDDGSVGLSTLAVTLPQALPYLADALRRPDFPAEPLARAQRQVLAGIAQSGASLSGILSLNQNRLTFGPEHPYGRFNNRELLARGVASATSADLHELYASVIRPDAGYFVVVGDVRPDAVLALLEQNFGDWRPAPGVARRRPPTAPLPTGGGRLYFFDQPSRGQSLITVTHPFAPDDSHREALDLANAVFGGNFISRLNLNLREDKHWSYGASSSYNDDRLAWQTLARAQVQTDKTAESLAEMAREITDFRGPRPPTGPELRDARDGLLKSLPGQGETAASVARLYGEILRNGWPDDYYDHYATRLEGVGDADAARAARELLPAPGGLDWFVVGDAAAVGAPVAAFARAQGLAFQRLDLDGRPVTTPLPPSPPAPSPPVSAPAAPGG